MSELNANKECILDYFGKCVIEEVYDRAYATICLTS